MLVFALLATLVLPFVGVLIILLLGRVAKRAPGYIALTIAAMTFISLILVILETIQVGEVKVDFAWISVLGPLISFRVDNLGLLFAFVASLFGFLTILYSIGDMRGKQGTIRYYSLMLLFTGSMLGLFLANNLLLLFYFWETVGVCSYLLIGFNYSKESSRASLKALLITSFAGAFLLVGILFVYFFSGTLELSEISAHLREPMVLALVIPLFLIAAMAKSAQFPLHVWLPDATVAPSGVTAYLHAAAMVKAGVYLVVRSYATFSTYLPSFSFDFVVATIGVVTLTVGCMAAFVQVDIKRVLAFSTIGQIGYIFLGIGLGTTLGVAGGLFHFLNHAFFKGLLFLCAGCLIYATGTKKLNEMGGLLERMPITASCMIIGALSLGAIPPFNGFASKLMIYWATFEKGIIVGGVHGGVYVIYCIMAMFGSAITLATLMKVINSAFFGQLPSKLKTTKEVPATMYIPLLILSAICLIFGIAPQLALNYFVNPAVQIVVGGVVETTTLGIVTMIGFYEATTIAAIVFIPLIVGILIYRKVSTRDLKYDVFVGGEAEKPYIDMEKVKADAESFNFATVQMFNRYYRFMWRGGLDRIYQKLAAKFLLITSYVRRTHVGVVNIYSAWIILGAIALIVLVMI